MYIPDWSVDVTRLTAHHDLCTGKPVLKDNLRYSTRFDLPWLITLLFITAKWDIS
jgi:hypothetical protein